MNDGTRSKAITRDDVLAVYIDLKKSNATPTSRSVRDALGRGSLTTIQKHLRDIADAGIDPAGSFAETLARQMEVDIQSHHQKIADERIAIAQAEFDADTEALTKILRDTEASLAESDLLAEGLKVKITDSEALVTGGNDLVATLQENVTALTETNIHLNARLEGAQAQLSDLAQLGELFGQLDSRLSAQDTLNQEQTNVLRNDISVIGARTDAGSKALSAEICASTKTHNKRGDQLAHLLGQLDSRLSDAKTEHNHHAEAVQAAIADINPAFNAEINASTKALMVALSKNSANTQSRIDDHLIKIQSIVGKAVDQLGLSIKSVCNSQQVSKAGD